MRKVLGSLVAFLTILSSASAQPAAAPAIDPARLEVIDLTHPLDASFPYIPVEGITFPFALQPIATLERNRVAANAWRVHEHLGTQIDAPNHFNPGGIGLEGLSARDLIVPVIVIDFRAESERDRDAVLTVQHIRAWEQRHGRIPARSVVALYTGWDARVRDASYIGVDANGVKHFPGIGVEAALFLANERDVWGVAVDTISFDPGPDGTYATHRALLGRDRWALEAINNLGRLPPHGAYLFIGAPRVPGATGGPARVIAMMPRDPAGLAGATPLAGTWESVAGEPLGSGPSATYLRRRFAFDGDRWSITFTLSKDAAGREPLLRGLNEGRYTVEAGAEVTRPARFGFETRRLTPLSPDVAAALGRAGCAGTGWVVGETREVGGGCAAFRVPAISACAAEYDVLRIDGDRMFLGARPASGDLCDAARRPSAASNAALRRLP